MNWQEALEEIQSTAFDVNLNVVSGTNAFFRAASREPAVVEAFHLMQHSGELCEEAFGRIWGLAREETDPQFQNPNDTALAVLLWLTRFTAPELVEYAAGIIDQTPRCWYAKELAHRILNPPPSLTGNPQFWGCSHGSRNLGAGATEMKFLWVDVPKQSPKIRFAFPTTGTSTADETWGSTVRGAISRRAGAL